MWIHLLVRNLLNNGINRVFEVIFSNMFHIWGQVLANRPDIIREDYMNELCILQDDVPPFPNEVKILPFEEFVEQDIFFVIMCHRVVKLSGEGLCRLLSISLRKS